MTTATAVGGGEGSTTALAEAAAMAEEATVAADRRRGPQLEAETRSTGVSETLMPRDPTRGIAPSRPSARFASAFAIARCVVVRWLRCTKIRRLAHENVGSDD